MEEILSNELVTCERDELLFCLTGNDIWSDIYKLKLKSIYYWDYYPKFKEFEVEEDDYESLSIFEGNGYCGIRTYYGYYLTKNKELALKYMEDFIKKYT
jgi:hypothetical protein